MLLDKAALLTETELDLLRLHPRVGAELLRSPGFPELGVRAFAHPEPPDANAYRAGRTAPLGAAALALVDPYDAMTNAPPASAKPSPS